MKKNENITIKQKLIVDEYNLLNYCNAINNINLDNISLYKKNDGKYSTVEIAGKMKFLHGPEAYSRGYRLKISIDKPVDVVRDKFLKNDQDLMAKISDKIRIHNYKYNIECTGPINDFDSRVKSLVDEFNQISICNKLINFKLTDLRIYPSNFIENAQLSIYIPSWMMGDSKEKTKQNFIINFRAPFGVEEMEARVAKNDEALYRIFKPKINKIIEELPFKCDGKLPQPKSNPTPTDGPVDKSISNTGSKDGLNENIIRIKKIMY
jgi:hypothetical protein